MKNKVIEIVRWKANSGVSDQEMISAISNKLPDLKKVKGFIHQSLYKNSLNEWVAVYYWETLEDAHNSNIVMEEKEAFKKLLSLINKNSIRIEAMETLQASDNPDMYPNS